MVMLTRKIVLEGRSADALILSPKPAQGSWPLCMSAPQVRVLHRWQLQYLLMVGSKQETAVAHCNQHSAV
jgi:hypothetical protein